MSAKTNDIEEAAISSSCYEMLARSWSLIDGHDIEPRLARFGMVRFMGQLLYADPKLSQRSEEVVKLVRLAVLFTMTERLMEDATARRCVEGDLPEHRVTWMRSAWISWFDRAGDYLRTYKADLESSSRLADQKIWENSARQFVQTLDSVPAFLTKTVLAPGFARHLPGLRNFANLCVLQTQLGLCDATSRDNDSISRELPVEALLRTLFLDDPESLEHVSLIESQKCLRIVVQLAKEEFCLENTEAERFENEIYRTHQETW
jgi:hypothetical protein